MSTLRQLWKQHPLATAGFAAGLAITLFFLVRALLFTLYWADHRQLEPESWMTPGYIAHSWHLPVEEVAAQLGITERPQGKPPTLADIARASGESEAALLARLEAWLETAAGPRP